MDGVLLSIAVLACPLSMAAMGWFMARGMRKDKPTSTAASDTDDLRRGQEAGGAAT